MAYTSIVNAPKKEGIVSVIDNSYLTKYVSNDGDILISQIGHIVGENSQGIKYGEIEGKTPDDNIKADKIFSYFTIQKDISHGAFSNSKVIAKGDKNKTNEIAKEVYEYFKEQEKTGSKHIPDITKSIMKSLILQSMQNNIIYNHYFHEPYTKLVNGVMNDAMNNYPNIRNIEKSGELFSGLVFSKKEELRQIARDIPENEFENLLDDVQRKFAQINLTGNSNNGISIGNKEDIKSGDLLTSTIFKTDFSNPDKNGKSEKLEVMRCFLKINKVSLDGEFEGELNFVGKIMYNKTYNGIPIKGTIDSFMTGSLEIDDSKMMSQDGKRDFNKFNALTDKEKSLVKATLKEFNFINKKIVEETVSKISSLFKVATVKEIDEMVLEELEKEDYYRYKNKQAPMSEEDISLFKENKKNEIISDFKEKLNDFYGNLGEVVRENFFSNSTSQVSSLVASAISDGAGKNNSNHVFNKRVVNMLEDALNTPVTPSTSNMNQIPLQEHIYQVCVEVVEKGVKILTNNNPSVAGGEKKIADASTSQKAFEQNISIEGR